MTTFRLWRALKNPPSEHPVYIRAISRENPSMSWYMACGAILLAPVLLPLGIVMVSTVYSLIWAINASTMIAEEQESGALDLLALLPFGAFGANWAIALACIHRNRVFSRIQAPGAWVIRLSFLFILLSVLRGDLSVFGAYQSQTLPELVYNLTLIAAIIISVYLDHVQSIVMSLLVALLIPQVVRSRFDARFWSFAGLLALLVITWFLAALAGFVVVPGLGQWLGLPRWWSSIGEVALSVLALYAIREGVIFGLWRILAAQFGVDSAKFDFLTANTV